jgi:hypothetical protein
LKVIFFCSKNKILAKKLTFFLRNFKGKKNLLQKIKKEKKVLNFKGKPEDFLLKKKKSSSITFLY